MPELPHLAGARFWRSLGWITSGLAAMACGGWAGWAFHGAGLQFGLARLTLLLDSGRGDETKAALAFRLASDPHDDEALALETRRRADVGDLAGARQIARRLLPATGAFAQAHQALGSAAVGRHDAMTAEDSLLAYLVLADPTSRAGLKAARSLLEIWRRQDRPRECEQLVAELLKRTVPERRATLGRTLGIDDGARLVAKARIGPLRQYVAGNPADLVSLGALALALGEDGQAAEALAALEPVLAAPGLRPEILWKAWIFNLYSEQRFEELRSALATVPPAERIHPWYLQALAAERQRAGDFSGALAAIQQALAVDDSLVDLNRDAAAIAGRAGRPDLAKAAEQRAELRLRREDEWRAATRALSAAMACRAPEAPAVARRAADAADALRKPGVAARLRQQAADIEATARVKAP